MVTRLVIASICMLLFCTASLASPSITRDQAIRIAAAKMKASGYDLRAYVVYGPVNYDSENSWWVHYRKKSTKDTELEIRIDDKTHKAYFNVP
jgi:hypothetical protein